MLEVNDVKNMCYSIHSLPDVEMYGGDTTPWAITMVESGGKPLPYSELSNCEAILTFVPFKASVGMNTYTQPSEVFLKVNGALNDGGFFIFSFEKKDTLKLRGKYVYQIEFRSGEDSRLAQGVLYVRQNIDINT